MFTINIDDSLLKQTFKEMEEKINLQKEYIDNLKKEVDILKSKQADENHEIQKLKNDITILQDKTAWNIFTESIKKLFNTNKISRLKETTINE